MSAVWKFKATLTWSPVVPAAARAAAPTLAAIGLTWLGVPSVLNWIKKAAVAPRCSFTVPPAAAVSVFCNLGVHDHWLSTAVLDQVSSSR